MGTTSREDKQYFIAINRQLDSRKVGTGNEYQDKAYNSDNNTYTKTVDGM